MTPQEEQEEDPADDDVNALAEQRRFRLRHSLRELFLRFASLGAGFLGVGVALALIAQAGGPRY